MTDVHLIELYCAGPPDASHERRRVTRMARTLRMDDTTGWAVAREDGRRYPGDDRDRDRLDLRCPARGCRVSAQVVVDETRSTRGYERLVEGLNEAARSGLRELPLHAVAGIVSR